MKLSVVIPTYTITKYLETLTYTCMLSLRESVDEIIICEDGGFFSPLLFKPADMYLYSLHNEGFTKNVNKGIKLARGEYIAVVNSDTQVASGNILDLCIPGKVACPITKGEIVPLLAGHFFVAPREIFEEVGYLDERMRMFCSDAAFEKKVKDRIIKVPTVSIYHEIGQTLLAAGLTDGKQLEIDRKAYGKT